MTATTQEVHVRVCFPWCGMVLDYRAERGAAERLAGSMREYGIDVAIDEMLHDGLGPLPCAGLWVW